MADGGTAPAPERPDVVDVLTVDVQPGTRVLVTSDLHFSATRTAASEWAENELGRVLASWEGAGILVLAGDIIELWAGTSPDAVTAMAAHPRFASAIRAFAGGEGRRVICLPGNHDGRIAWDPAAAAVAKDILCAELAFAVELTVATEEGPRTVRVEHGHRFDPANRFDDPRNPADTPLGQHIVQEILPSLKVGDEGLMAGVESLADPRTFPAFVTSRVFYRRLLTASRWLLVPLVLAAGMHFGVVVLSEPKNLGLTAKEFVLLDVAVVALTLIMGAVLVLGGRRAWGTASAAAAEKRGKGQNDNARAAGEELVRRGYAGLVTGHTHHPEISSLGAGFYANTGSGTKVVDRVHARFGLPNVFLPRLQLSWVVLEATTRGWTARLIAGRKEAGGSSWVERAVARHDERIPPELGVVGVVGEDRPAA